MMDCIVSSLQMGIVSLIEMYFVALNMIYHAPFNINSIIFIEWQAHSPSEAYFDLSGL